MGGSTVSHAPVYQTTVVAQPTKVYQAPLVAQTAPVYQTSAVTTTTPVYQAPTVAHTSPVYQSTPAAPYPGPVYQSVHHQSPRVYQAPAAKVSPQHVSQGLTQVGHQPRAQPVSQHASHVSQHASHHSYAAGQALKTSPGTQHRK